MSADKAVAATPVTIITGFLGSGKTTLLKHILTGDHGRKVAVIQNELAAETGIEAPSSQGVTGPKGEVFADWVELANGCVCCSVRDDLVSALEVLVKREGFDNILIETTGLADPGPLASIFWLDDALESALQLDAIVTVVDSRYCMQHLDEEKQATQVNECARQIAFADRIIVNKQDLVSDSERESLLGRIRGINPTALLQPAEYSKVPIDVILGINAFDLEHAAQLLRQHQQEEQGCLHSKDADCSHCASHKKLHARHGNAVGTVTLTLIGEFDVERFRRWLGFFLWEDQARLGMEVYRYKGLLSVVSEDAQYVLQGVHDTFELEPGPTKKSGDRPTSKVVFIGKGLDEKYFREQLQPLLSSPKS